MPLGDVRRQGGENRIERCDSDTPNHLLPLEPPIASQHAVPNAVSNHPMQCVDILAFMDTGPMLPGGANRPMCRKYQVLTSMPHSPHATSATENNVTVPTSFVELFNFAKVLEICEDMSIGVNWCLLPYRLPLFNQSTNSSSRSWNPAC